MKNIICKSLILAAVLTSSLAFGQNRYEVRGGFPIPLNSTKPASKSALMAAHQKCSQVEARSLIQQLTRQPYENFEVIVGSSVREETFSVSPSNHRVIQTEFSFHEKTFPALPMTRWARQFVSFWFKGEPLDTSINRNLPEGTIDLGTGTLQIYLSNSPVAYQNVPDLEETAEAFPSNVSAFSLFANISGYSFREPMEVGQNAFGLRMPMKKDISELYVKGTDLKGAEVIKLNTSNGLINTRFTVNSDRMRNCLRNEAMAFLK